MQVPIGESTNFTVHIQLISFSSTKDNQLISHMKLEPTKFKTNILKATMNGIRSNQTLRTGNNIPKNLNIAKETKNTKVVPLSHFPLTHSAINK